MSGRAEGTIGGSGVVAIIPARGGSERIPRKNIKSFAGRPIIAYSIEAARGSGLFDRIIVSTDDEEIASTAIEFGAEVPFRRPAEIADAQTGTNAVVAHALDWMAASRGPVSAACCIYATAPLLRSEDIRQGYGLLDGSVDFAFSGAEFDAPVQRGFRLSSKGQAEMLHPELSLVRSQDLESVYHDAAQFYWGWPAAFATHASPLVQSSRVVVLPRFRVVDIDTPDDWLRAELIYAALTARGEDGLRTS